MGIKAKIILLAVLLGSMTAVCVGGLSVYNTYTMRDEILTNYRQTMIEKRGHKLESRNPGHDGNDCQYGQRARDVCRG